MPGLVAGTFFYLYLIVDFFSRKIMGWEVHEREGADLAAMRCKKRSGPRPASRGRWSCMPTPILERGQPDEGCHDEGDDGKTEHHGLL